jgi:hypothetical protein
MSFKFLQQVIIFGLSLGIIFLYIQPKLVELRTVQAEVAQYSGAIENATQFANTLQSLLNVATTISRADEQAMETFLPRNIDPVEVSRDLQTIALRSGVRTQSLSYSETVVEDEIQSIQDASVANTDQAGQLDRESQAFLLAQTPFAMTVEGTYEQFYRFLQSLEANVYPLTVTNITVSFTEPNENQIAAVREPIGQFEVTINVASVGESSN